MNRFAVVDRWYGSSASKKALSSPWKSDTWVCMPEPWTPSSGLGMNVAWTPSVEATSFTTSRNVMTLSAMVSASVWRRSISCWLGRVLVERVLDRDAERLQGPDRLLAQRAGDVVGGQVEERALVQRLRRLPLGAGSEVEELQVRGDVEGELAFPGPVQVAAQHVAGVPVERCAVEVGDVAEHPGLGSLRIAPGEQLEGVRIRHRQDVALLDPAEPVDGGAVEGHPLLQRVLQLCGADGEALELAEHVGEPEANEADPALLHRPHDVVLVSLHAHRLQSGPGWRCPRQSAMANRDQASAEQMVSVISRVTV